MTTRVSTGFRNRILGQESFEDIFGYGIIYVFSGDQPAGADSAFTGTLLGRITDLGGAFSHGSPTNGLRFLLDAGVMRNYPAQEWILRGITEGTAGWYRLCANPADDLGDSLALPRIDGSCGTSGSDMILPNTAITSSTNRAVSSFSYIP